MSTAARNSCLNDTVSVLFYKCLQNTQYLLTDSNGMYTLPNSKLLENNWSKTADHIIENTFGKISESKELLKINKVWVPNFPRRHAYHIVFSIQISANGVVLAGKNSKVIYESRKKENIENMLFQWLTFENIKEIRSQGNLCSPEIVAFITLKEASGTNEKPFLENNLVIFEMCAVSMLHK